CPTNSSRLFGRILDASGSMAVLFCHWHLLANRLYFICFWDFPLIPARPGDDFRKARAMTRAFLLLSAYSHYLYWRDGSQICTYVSSGSDGRAPIFSRREKIFPETSFLSSL